MSRKRPLSLLMERMVERLKADKAPLHRHEREGNGACLGINRGAGYSISITYKEQHAAPVEYVFQLKDKEGTIREETVELLTKASVYPQTRFSKQLFFFLGEPDESLGRGRTFVWSNLIDPDDRID